MRDYFVDTFPAHFLIEMCYAKKRRFGFLHEQIISHDDFLMLCEKYGVFNGCEEMADELCRQIKTSFKNGITDFRVKPTSQLFVDEIRIRIIQGKFFFYNSDTSEYGEDKRFSTLDMFIGAGKINDESLKPLLMHELTHAYEDWCRYNSKQETPSIANTAGDLGYGKNPIWKMDSYDVIKRAVSQLLYYLTDFERNAYVAQMKGQLSKSGQKFSDITQAYQFLKSTRVYQNYQVILGNANLLYSLDNEEKRQEVLGYVKELSNYDFNTYKEFKRWLGNKIAKTQKKFNEVAPKIASEYLTLSEFLNPPTDFDLTEKADSIEAYLKEE